MNPETIDRQTDALNDMINNASFDPKYFVVFYDGFEFVHMCGYEERPKVIDIRHLLDELETDAEFGMDREYLDSLSMAMQIMGEDNE